MSTIEQDGLAGMLRPFSANEIGKLPKPFRADNAKGNCKECGGYHGLPAAHLDYVGHAAITKRLLEVDSGWTWEPLAFDSDGLPLMDRNGGLWIRLTVLGVSRLGYGDSQGKQGGNAIKEAIGDALRNAAMRFGAALDLWHKGDLWDDLPEARVEAPRPTGPAIAPRAVTASPDTDWLGLLRGVQSYEDLRILHAQAVEDGALDLVIPPNGETLKSLLLKMREAYAPSTKAPAKAKPPAVDKPAGGWPVTPIGEGKK